ncbi:MAG: hypothetical protein ABWY78_17070, partial [Microvirga sp.]
MKDRFRKSDPPTDGMAPGPLAPPWPSEPNARELARLLGTVPGEDGLDGLEPFDFRATRDDPADDGRAVPVRPAIPDDLDRAFHERPSDEMDLFGVEDRPTGTREDEEAGTTARNPRRWRTIAGTFALASLLLVLSPFVLSYPYRQLTAAIPELSFETVAEAASSVRSAIPALTQSLQARLPGAEWLTAWLEPTAGPAQSKGSSLAVPGVAPTPVAPPDLGRAGRPTRLELASADSSFLERSDALRVRHDTLSLPSTPDHAIASGTGSDIILSAGPESLESAPAGVGPDAAAPADPSPANAEITPDPPAAPVVTEGRPLPAGPPAVPSAPPLNAADLDALLEKVSPPPSPAGPPVDAAAPPAPRLDQAGSVDPGAELVEALARERKEALDRERERADALARELAGLRDAIGAMKARTVPNWVSAPALPSPPTPPLQVEALPPPAEPAQAPPAKPEAARAETQRPEPQQPEPLQPEPLRAEPLRAEPLQAEPLQAEPLQAESKQAVRPLPAP